MKLLITGGSGFIGTNLHEFVAKNHEDVSIVNVDIVEPKIEFNNSIWEFCDILDKSKLQQIFNKHNPDCVIHLAAETSCEPHLNIKDFKVNIKGSANVFECAGRSDSVKSLIHTSTQFVNQFDFPLKDFFAYKPHTVYGESKVISEKLLFDGDYKFKWIIIRPSNIWGKWHLRYPSEFWKVLSSGKYLHPNKKNVIRSYGYVENVCDQIMKLIENVSELNKEIFYVGDQPIELYSWVNEFSKALKGRDVRVIPKELIYLLATFGDFLEKLNLKIPINRSRYKSMTLSNPAPMSKTFDQIGHPKVGLKEGVRITTDWLKKEVYKV